MYSKAKCLLRKKLFEHIKDNISQAAGEALSNQKERNMFDGMFMPVNSNPGTSEMV